MSEEKEILTIEEAAKFLGISKFSVRNYAIAGEIPSFRLGKLWRFKKGDLIDHLRKQYQQPAQKDGASTASV